MANIIVVASLGAALVAGTFSQFGAKGEAPRIPDWLQVPGHVDVSKLSGTRTEGRFELSFAGASDDELKSLRAGLEAQGFKFAAKPSTAEGIARAVIARNGSAGRRLEIDLRELPDHDVWQVAFFDGQQG